MNDHDALTAALLLPALLLGCSSETDSEAEEAQPELTRAQRDSVIAEMPIPGAGAVGTALDAAAAADRRAEAHDTIG